MKLNCTWRKSLSKMCLQNSHWITGYSNAPIKSLVLKSKEEADIDYVQWLDAHFMNHEGYCVTSDNSGKGDAPCTLLSLDNADADCNNLNNGGAPRNYSDGDDCEYNLSNKGKCQKWFSDLQWKWCDFIYKYQWSSWQQKQWRTQFQIQMGRTHLKLLSVTTIVLTHHATKMKQRHCNQIVD